MFGRRVVQRELEFLETSGVLVQPKRADTLNRLNGREARRAIAAEWEVILLAAVARRADVEYEKPFGSKYPDLLVRFPAPDGPPVEFVGEIVSVSDEHEKKRNPVGYFTQEFNRIAWKMGHDKGGFDIRIGDRTVGTYPEKRTKLLLPSKQDVPEFLKRHVAPFIRGVIAHPTVPQNFEWCGSSEIALSIKYDPSQLGWNSGGYASYSSPMALRSNVLYRNLDDKASDLRKSGYTGLKGILVVDAGCQALCSSDRRGGNPWGRGEIVEEFLKRHPYIHFVTTTHYEYRTWAKPHHTLCHNVFWQRPFDESVIQQLYPVLNDSLRSLPSIKTSPQNAQIDIRSGEQFARGCRHTWHEWSPTTKLAYSSRTFLRLVAGIVSHEEFRTLFVDNLPNRGPFFDFFRHVAESKAKLLSIEVIQRPDDDDDSVVFKLRGDSVTPCKRSTLFCDIPTATLLRYFVCLAYEAIMDQRRFSIGTLPISTQAFVRQQMREGRLLVGAMLVEQGQTVRLHFGSRDAAISPFW